MSRTSSPSQASSTPTNKWAQQLVTRLDDRTATIGVVGLGYVGLPLAVEYAGAGFDTVGIDLNEERVRRLDAGDNYIDDVDDEEVRDLVEDEQLRIKEGFAEASDIDVFFVCVPTPVTETKDPDLSYVKSAADAIAEHLRPGQLLVLKSTTYPSTTEEVVLPRLQESDEGRGLTVGEDYFLAYSPERIDPGNQTYQTDNIPVVVGGVTDACTDVAEAAIRTVNSDVHLVSNPKVAEMEKLLENIFRSVNIALVNELAQLCDRLGEVSMWEVIDAASTKPFGYMPFYPGPGLGGHCIPIDPHFLSWMARKYDFETSFITLAARVNESMPYYAVDAVVQAIAEQPVRLADAEVLILGVAYKGDVNDTRHSPAERVIRLLGKKGVEQIRYHDPHVSSYRVKDEHGASTDVPSTDLTPEALRSSDVTVIVTDHDAYDVGMIAEHAPRIVDTRNALDDIDNPALREKITLLGGGKSNSDSS
ncbi:MAG: nucleotide sugar dehydrogenase [Salinibacter sp.]